METKVTDIRSCEKSIEIKVPYSEIKEEENAVYEEYRREAKIEGFRKGKAPLSMIKRMFGKTIEGYLIEKLINKYYRETIERENIKPVSEAKVQNVKYNKDEGLSFIAIIEVEPSFELAVLDDIKVQRETKKITEDEINKETERLRYEFGVKEKFEGEAQIGHYLLLDIQQLDSNTNLPLIGKKRENLYLRIGDNILGKGVEEQLIGIRIGERRVITTNVQQDMIQEGINNQNRGNRTSHFLIEVRNIEKIILPDLDDEFAKDVNENLNNLDDLKKYVKEILKERANFESDKNVRKQIENEILRRHEFDIPNGMIGYYLNNLLKDIKKESLEDVDEEYIKSSYRDLAIRNIKWYWIREKIIRENNIKVEDYEIDERIEEIAKRSGISPERARITYRSKKSREEIKEEILEDKLFSFLLEKTQIENVNIL